MSGGVDSSVAAALLKKQGYNIVGGFLKFWQPPTATRINADKKIHADQRGLYENTCCNQEALLQARKVTSILNIPFYVLDVSLKELEKVSKTGKMRDRTAARIGLELVKKAKVVKTESIKNVDTLLLEAAVKHNFVVATQDRELKNRLKEVDIHVLTLRQKKYVKMV